MKRSNETTRLAAFIVVALLVTAAGWVLHHANTSRTRPDSSRVKDEAAGRSPLPTPLAVPTAGAGPSAVSSLDPPTRSEPPVETRRASSSAESPSQPAGVVYASRLSGRPGYYPPDDPESLSVIAGKRDAAPVDLEFTGGAASLEELGRAILAALAAGDANALDRLRVTKHEFRVVCWPEFPESRPVTNITLDDAWMMAAAQSHAGSVRAIGLYGGRALELLTVETAGPFAYRNFTRRSGVVLVCRDAKTGETVRLSFAPSVVDRHGRYKVLVYRDR